MRNGLAHRYDTSLVVITWKAPHRHLQVRERDWLGDGVNRPGVYLDMETLWRALDSYFRRLNTTLQAERKLARLFVRSGKRLQDKFTVRVKDPMSVASWEQFLRERAVP